MNILQTTYLLLLSLLLFNVNTQNQSFNHYVNDVNTHEISSIGPPRELSLEITCDLLRPCIKASWLPPVNYQLDPIQQQNIKYNQHALTAYRLRYRIMHPIELTHVNVYHRKLNTTEFNNKLLSKIIEKNITDLQYTTNPGEHLFGVIYEVSVAAITKNGYGQETTGRIATPEAAPSDAPSNFRVVGGDQTSVQLAWDPPRLLYRNGIITKYQVRCYVVGAEENHDELKTLTEQTLKLTNLPAATHACLVRAWTKAGPGPWSDRIQFIINQKVPLPPINIHVYWKTQYVLTVKWTLPDDDTNLAYLIVHYATQTKPNVWHKYFVKDFKTTQDLNNLDPNEEYLIRLSSVDVNGNEGESSDIVSIHSYKHSLLTTTTNNNNDRKHTNFIYLDIPDQPEKFTVQNFQCIKKTMNTILIEWLPPIHLANLLEYKLHISGRSEFITSSGVLKSVHLGDIQLHQSVDQQIDNNQLQMLNWQLTDMIDSLSQLDNHQHHQRQQLTHKMQIPNLKPNSQYKITIRPIYRALITEGNIGTKEGIPVTILCHTEWSAPEYIRPPELLAIYSGPPDPYGPTSIIEVKLYRVSEENGPLHNYYVIVSPELEYHHIESKHYQ
ncbi:Tyrosine-protein phosphatase Lar [Schistosoma japonicum]|uniref:Tyrosine-protein phosphatase Lar n=1 Tax=Schistosoma japonicum TaxID=6182 RepID=A0A4Z2D3C1_SCHJA|nr:Tyrosine-protein phosphatase Lar [Schistosoma japonicum]